MVVVHLAEWSLLTPHDSGLNPTISNIYKECLFCIEKTGMNEWPIFQKVEVNSEAIMSTYVALDIAIDVDNDVNIVEKT